MCYGKGISFSSEVRVWSIHSRLPGFCLERRETRGSPWLSQEWHPRGCADLRSGLRIRRGLLTAAVLVTGLLPGVGGAQVQAAALAVGDLSVKANPEGTTSQAQISFTGTCRATLVTFAWDGGTPTRALSCGNHTGGATAYASIVFHDAGPHTATATVGGQIRIASFTVADAAIVLTARPLTLVAGVNSLNFVATAADANQYWTCAQYTTTVDWGDGSTTPATCQVPPLGGASFGASHAYASPGNYTMTVTLVDRGGVTVTGSAPVTVSGNVSRSVALTTTSQPNPSCVGQAVVLTAVAAASPPGSGTPTGNVSFSEGPTPLGTVPLDPSGHATLSSSTLTAGAHVIGAQYSGDPNFPGSASSPVTQTVNATCPGGGGGTDEEHETDSDDSGETDNDTASEAGSDHGDATDHPEGTGSGQAHTHGDGSVD
jgi:hypothetical protein